MRIGFDAKRAFLNTTGLGNYSRTLLNALQRFYPEHHYFLYTPKKKEIVANGLLELESFITTSPKRKIQQLFGGSLWRSVFLGNQLRRDRLDIYHGLSHELPFNSWKSQAKMVVTIHDLIFLEHPELYPTFDRWMYARKWKYSCRVADRIVAISEKTKQSIVKHLQIDEQKIKVIHQSCDPVFYDYSELMYLRHGFWPAKYNIPYELPENYVLYVGTISERKNLLVLVKALRILWEKNQDMNVKLVVVGGETTYKEKILNYINQYNLENKVLWLGHVNKEHLAIIYRKAQVLAYPSISEGFGLPIVEALFSKIPVVAASGAKLEEAGGADTVYIDPKDVETWANNLHNILISKDLREKMVAAGWEYAQQFTLENTTRKMMDLYELLLH